VLFDEEWYARQVGRRFDREAAVRDYLTTGHREGRSPHPLFDPAAVRARWSPQRLAELGDGDPLTLYLRRRVFARSPHPLFDRDHYLQQAPGSLEHPAGPVGHYVETGAAAGLTPNDWLPAGERLEEWVVAAYADALAVAAEPGTTVVGGEAGRRDVSVLLVADDAVGPLTTVRRLLADTTVGAASEAAEIVVLDNATPPLTRLSLASLTRHPQVRLVRAAEPLAPAAAREVALEHATGASVVLVDAGTRPADGWLPPLVTALADDGVAAAQALLLRPDGTVRSAGLVVPEEGAAYDLLDGFPVEDARVAGEPFGGARSAVLALRRADADAVLAGRPADDLALSRALRARTGAALRVVPGSVVVVRDALPSVPAVPDAEPGLTPDDERLWAACGFAVRGRDAAGRPALRWVGPPGSQTPPVRWAIKNPAPSGPVGEVWGDTHFARSLARELRRLGAHVVVDHRPAWHRASGTHDDVALVIRGPEAYQPRAGGPRTVLAWVISYPDTVTGEEVRAYDRVLAASTVWAERAAERWGVPVEPMLQATDADRFTPDSAEPDTGAGVLFVGNTRGVYRTIVRDAVESGLDLTVYGRGWHVFLDPALVAGYRIDNHELSAVYRSARVVLNDHFDDMRREGFLSNRLFDAAASGARVVTDDVPGLDDVFGPLVQVYRTRDDLVALATLTDPDPVFGDDAERRRVAEVVRREHSFTARARRLVEVAAELRDARD